MIARQCYVLLLEKGYYVAILMKSTSIYIYCKNNANIEST